MDQREADRLAETFGKGTGQELSERWIEFVDSHYESPRQRAERVWEALQASLESETSDFDVTCFAIEWLGRMATGPFSADDSFVAFSKALGKWLYNAHYFNAPAIHGPPKEREENGSGED